jgi:hypothetical protein
MALGLGTDWWKCCRCEREIQKVFGDEKCVDCDHDKCSSCEDPCVRLTDWSDLIATQTSSLFAIDDAAEPTPCDGSLLDEDTSGTYPLKLQDGAALLQTGSLVKSNLSPK